MTEGMTDYQGYDAVLGLELQDIGPDRVTARLEVQPHLHQPYGIVHGGVYCSVIESAASVGAAFWYGDRGKVVGVMNHTNFLRAAGPGTRVTAIATPIHRGRLQQLWQVEISDADGRQLARGEVRLQNLPATDGATAQ